MWSRAFASLLLTLLLAPLAHAAARGDEASARAAVLARFDAALRADSAALEKLLADDLEYCGVSGTCSTKREYLDSIRSGARRFSSLVPSIKRVKLYADAAIVTATVAADATYNGVQRHIDAYLLIVLAWRAGRWQMTNQSSTSIAASAN